MAGRTEILVKSFLADGAILNNRFIKAGSVANSAAQAAAATDAIIGVSSDTVSALTGEMADGILMGMVNIKLGGTVFYGGLLTSDATGRAVAASGATTRVGGIAMAAGVINDVIPMLISLSIGA